MLLLLFNFIFNSLLLIQMYTYMCTYMCTYVSVIVCVPVSSHSDLNSIGFFCFLFFLVVLNKASLLLQCAKGTMAVCLQEASSLSALPDSNNCPPKAGLPPKLK